MLMNMKSLLFFNLSLKENLISDAGIKLFFDYLKEQSSLIEITLDLSSN